MKRTATFVSVAAAACLAATAIHAQADGPAEIPPESFTGQEYVDSTGCVFSRVTLGDEDVWVPRVTADRQPLCGRTPTLAAGPVPETDAGADMAAAPDPQAREGGPVVAEATAATPIPPPMRTTIRRQADPSAPSGMTVVHVPSPPVSVADLVPVRAVTAEEAAALGHPGVLLPPNLAPAEVYLRNTCPGRAGLAYAYVAEPPAGCRTVPMHASDIVHGTERPTPRPSHSPVARLRIDRPTAPPGYRVAWDDGRLNPYRGIRTPEGDARTRMIWTDTVPRRLVPAD